MSWPSASVRSYPTMLMPAAPYAATKAEYTSYLRRWVEYVAEQRRLDPTFDAVAHPVTQGGRGALRLPVEAGCRRVSASSGSAAAAASTAQTSRNDGQLFITTATAIVATMCAVTHQPAYRPCSCSTAWHSQCARPSPDLAGIAFFGLC